MPRTRVSENQIQFQEIFSIEKILASHGFHVESKGNLADTLIVEENEEDVYFALFNDEAKRKSLTNYIAGNSPHPKEFSNLSIIKTLNGNYNELRKKLSTTFEWYVGKLIEKEFSAFSSAFGVNVRNVARLDGTLSPGDYDSLVVLRNLDVMFLECKMGSQSSNGLTKTKILNAIDRGIALHTAATVMFLEEGVNESNLYLNLHDQKHPLTDRTDDIKEIYIRSNPSSVIYKWFDCYFLNASTIYGDVKSKLNSVFRIIQANQAISRIGASSYSAIPFSEENYKKLGYECRVINNSQT